MGGFWNWMGIEWVDLELNLEWVLEFGLELEWVLDWSWTGLRVCVWRFQAGL